MGSWKLLQVAATILLLGSVLGAKHGEESDSVTSASQQPQGRVELQHRKAQVSESRYQICPGDTLDIDFAYVPEFNQTVTVAPDGYITLRVIGGIVAQGQTVPELTQSVSLAYAKVLHNPVLTIAMKDFAKPFVIVTGEVRNPGKLELRGEMTASQAVGISGGFSENAKHSQVLLFRRVSDKWTEVRELDLKKMLNAKDIEIDPLLKPGDMLYVPKSFISKVKKYIPFPGMYFDPSRFF